MKTFRRFKNRYWQNCSLCSSHASTVFDTDSKLIQILVLTPTRELGIQVANSFEKYATSVDRFQSGLPLWWARHSDSDQSPKKRNPKLLLLQSGRLIDHIKRNNIKLENLKSVILDEADEMLNMGFLDDVEEILENAPDESQMVFVSQQPCQKASEELLTTF